MGRRGPKPTPKALRLLRRGTTTTRTPAPLPATDPPVMPAGLDDAEQACWHGLMNELAAVPGLVSRADRGICELIARLEPAMRRAAVVVREQGPGVTCLDKEGAVKFIQQRVETAFLIKAGAQLKTLYAELGLSPSGRSRVSVSPAAADSKLDRFLAVGGRGA